MKRIVFLLLVLMVPVAGRGQVITTVAGNGTATYTGSGPATATGIGNPASCAFDSDGNFYFGGGGGGIYGDRVFKVTPCGVITTVAGISSAGYNGDNIPATTAQLDGPLGIVLDAQNNLYIADVLNNRVRKVDAASGIITTIAGTGLAGYDGDHGPATAALLNEPSFICFDRRSNLYIIDQVNARIRKIDTFGVITTYAGNGIGGYTPDGVPATSAEIEDLYGICADTIGNIFFGIQDSMMVRKIDTTGILTTIAGNGTGVPSGDGGPAMSADLEPGCLAFDRLGNLYISGLIENDVRKINDSGIIYTVAGNTIGGFSGDGGSADSAELYHPYGIAVDAYNNLYMADDLNRRIRKVTFNPVTIPTITITANPGDTVCSSSSVIFSATVTGGSAPFTYQWMVNGSATGAASTYTYTPTNGDSIRCLLSVNGLCIMPSSNAIHMVVDSPCTTGHISIASSQAISTYPNPAYDLLNIDNIKTQCTYYLINTIGSTLQQGTLQAGSNSISVQSLPPGVYILEISGEGVRDVVRVVKE